MNIKTEIKGESWIFGCVLKVLAGVLIGVGAVLPGVSGGVLCVIFGIYPVVMDLISHPFRNLKEKLKVLYPYIIGVALGFWVIARVLELLLTRFEAPSVCIFIGLVAGMLPSLFVSLGSGKNRFLSYLGLALSCLAVLSILSSLRAMSVSITPNFFWYIISGVAIAISIIVPGMSFSTLLMPLGLYTPLVQGIGEFNLRVLIPVGIGALGAFCAFSRLVSALFEKHYTVAQNIVIGVVIAATAMIIPFDSFTSWSSAAINLGCIILGIFFARMLSHINQKYEHRRAEADGAE